MSIWQKRTSAGDTAIPLDTPLDSLRYVVLDTELTSLEHRTNRLLSVGAIAMQGASIRLGEQLYSMVNPAVEVPAESVVIHQIRSLDAAAAEDLSKSLEELDHFLRGAVLVGHFAHIDLKILRKEMAQTGHTFENPAVDTARVHHWLLRQGPYHDELPLQLEKLDLESVATFYGCVPESSHHALADAFLTARIWQKMLVRLHKSSVRNLGKLLKIAAAK